MISQTGRPVNGYDPRAVMDAKDEESRRTMLRQMGVMNVDPPLPHSPCLKNIRTGVVLPWNELLAQQRDLVVCCDENGDTDPAAWEPKVIVDGVPNDMLLLMAQKTLFDDSPTTQFEHYMPQAKQVAGQSEYEKRDAVPFTDIQKLRERLNADTADNTGSVEGPERSGSGQ